METKDMEAMILDGWRHGVWPEEKVDVRSVMWRKAVGPVSWQLPPRRMTQPGSCLESEGAEKQGLWKVWLISPLSSSNKKNIFSKSTFPLNLHEQMLCWAGHLKVAILNPGELYYQIMCMMKSSVFTTYASVSDKLWIYFYPTQQRPSQK